MRTAVRTVRTAVQTAIRQGWATALPWNRSRRKVSRAPKLRTPEATADDTSIESVAAGGIQGTEAPEDGERTAADTDRPPAAGSGQAPDDIPAPNNDSVLEAQIRRAAMEETDPRIRAELWNEYRKYKDCP